MRLVDELSWLTRSSPSRRRIRGSAGRTGARLRGQVGARVGARARRRSARDARTGARTACAPRWPSCTRRLARRRGDAAIGRLASSSTGDERARRRARSRALDPSFRAQELSFAVSQIARQHRPDRGRRAAQLAATGCSAASRAGLAGTLVGRAGAGRRPRRPALGLAAQQRARRVGARPGGARREPDRRAALVLGRARHALGAALERAQHRPERRPRRCSARRSASSSAPALLAADRHQHDGAVVPAPAGGPARRVRAGGDLVRRRAGRVHADAA